MLAVRPRAREAVERLLLESCRVSIAVHSDANEMTGTQMFPDRPKQPGRELRVHPRVAGRAAVDGVQDYVPTKQPRRRHRPSIGGPA